MVTIRSLKKTTILLLITTLTISLGASLSDDDWNSPNSGETFQNGDIITFNVTNTDNAPSINFSVNSGYLIKNNTGVENKKYVTSQVTVGSRFSSGQYTVTAEASNGSDIQRDFTVDKGVGSISFQSTPSYVGSDATITVEVSDSLSGVSSISASATNGASVEVDNNCDGSESCSADITIDTSGLDQGSQFDLEVTAEDSVGNTDSKEIQDITFDSKWDGDESASVEWAESGSNVLSGFSNEDQDIVVSLQGDSVSETTVKCKVDGEVVAEVTKDAQDEVTDFNCNFDASKYSGSRFDLTVKASDAAGNSKTVVEGKQMIWDTSAPDISSLESSNGVSTFNDPFNLSVEVVDEAAGIETLEYYFDPSTSVGDGKEISLDGSNPLSVDKTFGVEPDNLGQGNHTVYVRAVDGTGETSVEEFDFEYYPSREPSVKLRAPESVEVVSGQSKDFTLTIENGAPFFLDRVKVTSDSAVWDGSVRAIGLEDGDSVKKVITVDASELDVGVYNLTLKTASLDDSVTVDVIVRATDSQKDEINSSVQKWVERKKSLEKNVSRIGTLEMSNENITDFTQAVSKMQQAVENGEYYRAKSYLENIDSKFSQASNVYSERLEVHRNKQQGLMLLLALFGVLVIGGGAGGYMFYSREGMSIEVPEPVQEKLPEDLPSKMPDELPEVLGSLPDASELKDKARKLVNEAEDEVEEETGYSFEGFS